MIFRENEEGQLICEGFETDSNDSNKKVQLWPDMIVEEQLSEINRSQYE